MNKKISGRLANVKFMAGKTAITVRPLTMVTIWAMIIALLSVIGGCRPAPACTGDAGKFTCEGRSAHQITISDVPEGFRPELLTVTDDREKELRNAPKEGTGCIFVIVGDLAFYDKDNHLISNPKFDSPVTIAFSFTADDMKAFEDCKATLIQSGTVTSETPVDYVPVYFFNDKWKPFDEKTYTIDPDGNVTIQFTSWGDSPFGGGSKP